MEKEQTESCTEIIIRTETEEDTETEASIIQKGHNEKVIVYPNVSMLLCFISYFNLLLPLTQGVIHLHSSLYMEKTPRLMLVIIFLLSDNVKQTTSQIFPLIMNKSHMRCPAAANAHISIPHIPPQLKVVPCQ